VVRTAGRCCLSDHGAGLACAAASGWNRDQGQASCDHWREKAGEAEEHRRDPWASGWEGRACLGVADLDGEDRCEA
jgi:hypothetical protein